MNGDWQMGIGDWGLGIGIGEWGSVRWEGEREFFIRDMLLFLNLKGNLHLMLYCILEFYKHKFLYFI